MARKIVILGANASGVDAASAARKTDRSAEIFLITKEKWPSYSRCGLPFVLGKHISRFEELVIFSPSYYEMMRFDLRLKTTATAINKDERSVEIRDDSGKKEILNYDQLILATGATPFIPPIKGRGKNGVYVLRTIDDGEEIERNLENAESAVIIGAGLVGLETAAAFVERGIETNVVELLPHVLPAMIDRDIAKIVHEKLEENGVRVIVGQAVNEIVGENKVTGISIGKKKIQADLVVASTGVRPNTKLAEEAGITIGVTGGIRTNMRMETNIKNIFAVGDCAESINPITLRPVLSQLGTTAVRQGKVAGINAAGGYALFHGSLGSSVSRMFDFEVGATGLSESIANQSQIEIITGSITSKTKADYYPGAMSIRIKLIVEKETRRIIGGQIIGGEEVTQRINALSLAIQKQMTIYELANADTCYAPPLNETWEPMVLAAEVAIRRLK